MDSIVVGKRYLKYILDFTSDFSCIDISYGGNLMCLNFSS